MERDSVFLRNVSYLRARDASLLTRNVTKQLDTCRANLIDEFGEVTQHEKSAEEEDGIRVYLRIKKGYDFKDLYQIKGKTLTSMVPPGSNFLRNIREGETMKKTYSFTKIFESETTQTEIFDSVVKPKLLDFLNGHNSTLLTYGASGSGKTFTVIGTDTAPGLVPRSLEYLFRTLPELSNTPMAKPSPAGEITLLNEQEGKKEKLLCRSLLNASTSSADRSHHAKSYLAMQQRLSSEPVAELEADSDISILVWISFAEIYNEQIYDLLQLDPPRGKQRPKLRLGMCNNEVYIKNLTYVNVTTGLEAYQLLQHGIHNLSYARTRLNDHSSRSHSIFTIKLLEISKKERCGHQSSFHFCDLAGSERTKKTHNVGERLKESNNINSSLLVLGRCISAVRNAQKQGDNKLVPFRESKLTQLFQKAFTGGEDVAMVVTISPNRDMFDESQHVLSFAAIAKQIILEQPATKTKQTRFSELVASSSTANDFFCRFTEEDYQKHIELLHEELEVQKIDYESNNKMNLDYLREEYNKILEEVEERNKVTLKKKENLIRLRYETQMKNLKLHYESKINELKEGDVIEIGSSEEESPSPKKPKVENSNKIVASVLCEGIEDYKRLEEKYNQLKQDHIELRKVVMEMENELSCYKHRIRELTEEREDSDFHEENTI